MSEFLTILKKELKMFFSNRRLLISSVIPGVIMMLFYIIANNIPSSNDFSKDSFSIGVINEQIEYDNILLADNYSISFNQYNDLEQAKTDLENNSIELIINYDPDFASKVSSSNTPNLDLYYDSTSDKSTFLYEYVNGAFIKNGTTITYKYSINATNNADVSNGKGEIIRIMALLIPYILITVLFSGCVNATSTVIAGEKERGTMATLLVTPVKRSTICFGKIAALSIIALFTSTISLTFSYIGTLLSKSGELVFDLSLYSPIMIVELLLVVFISVIFFTVVLSCISTYSKSVKEANSVSGALELFILILAMTSITGFKPSSDWFYAIPLYNSVLTINSLFNTTLTLTQFFIMLSSTVVYILVSIFICKKMFESEKIMLSKK